MPSRRRSKSSSGGKSKSNRNEETVNYEITKTVKSHIREGGVVNRLSVAVLVDGVYAAAQDGARNYQPRSPEELQQLGALVRSAIGYNQQRGDTVEVVNLRFVATDEPVVAASSLPLGLSKGDVMRIAETLVLSMVALLVFLFVVRPFLGRLTASVEAPALAGAAPGTPLLTDQSGGAPGVPALTGPEGTSLVPVDDGDEAMININQVEGRVKASSMKKINEIVDKHPEETIAILRSWMYEKE